MRPRTVVVIITLAVIGVAGLAVPAGRTTVARLGSRLGLNPRRPAGELSLASQFIPPPPTMQPPATAINLPGLFSWALYDSASNTVSGSANRGDQQNGTTTVESMIKPWIAADYLRTHTPTSTDLTQLAIMVERSDDHVAQTYWHKDGNSASLTRLNSICGLSDAFKSDEAGIWSYIMMSANDAIGYGRCLADGRAAGPTYTAQLLGWMRQVQGAITDQHSTYGGGRWGIIDALPLAMADQTAIKNGWTAQIYDGNWHVNCLAINPTFVLVVMAQFQWTGATWQTANNLSTGDDICHTVTTDLLHVPDL